MTQSSRFRQATAAVSSSDEAIAAQYQSALRLHQAGQIAEAERLYRQLLQTAPGHSGATHYLGVIALQRGRITESLTLLEASVAASPDKAEFQNNLGQAYLAAERWDDAAVCFRRSIDLDADNGDAFNNLGNLFLQQRQPEAALDVLRQAVKLDPDNYNGRCNLAWAMFQTGEVGQAEMLFRESADLRPDSPVAYRLLGSLLVETGRYPDAIDTLALAAERAPEDARIPFMLGLAHEQQSQLTAAAEHYRRALVLDPKHGGAAHNLQILSSYLELTDEVLADLDRKLSETPDSAELHFKRGRALWRADRTAESVVAFQRSLKLRPDSTETLLQLALFEPAGSPRRTELLENATKLEPQNTFVRAAAESDAARLAAPAGSRRVALFLEQQYHYHVQKPILDAARGRFDVLMTHDLRTLLEFDPQVVVVSSSQSASLRSYLPRALFVWTRHGLISKTTTHSGARGSDFACLTSEASREWYVRNYARPRRDFWITGFVQMDPLFQAETLPLPFDLPAGRPVVVYAPTWTPELASPEMFGDRLVDLVRGECPEAVLIIKPHPVSFSHSPEWIRTWRRLAAENEAVILADDPALNIVPVLKAADVLLGDVSSVLFQFLALDRPLVLVNNPQRFQSNYCDRNGIEWRWRDMGTQVDRIEDVPRAIADAVSKPDAQSVQRNRYRLELFGDLTDGGAGERIVEHIAALDDSEWVSR